MLTQFIIKGSAISFEGFNPIEQYLAPLGDGNQLNGLSPLSL
jgi:hypothetical protein